MRARGRGARRVGGVPLSRTLVDELHRVVPGEFTGEAQDICAAGTGKGAEGGICFGSLGQGLRVKNGGVGRGGSKGAPAYIVAVLNATKTVMRIDTWLRLGSRYPTAPGRVTDSSYWFIYSC